MNKHDLTQYILRFKRERNICILSHNYQRNEIQEIADCLGDSLDLARKAMSTQAQKIIFCGVHFMAESAKILSPHKTILLPEITAGCPLADCATVEQVKAMRNKHPHAVFIAYINTSAAVKAECDCVCTSANALHIIEHFKDREIVYLPDKNLAAYAEKMLQRTIIKWPGQCYVHHFRITLPGVHGLIAKHPEALIMTHPEAPMEILEISDIITGTSGMIKNAATLDRKEFIVLTEIGLIERLRREFPDKHFYGLAEAVCGQMKTTTLQSVYESIIQNQYEIHVDEKIIHKARNALERMMEFTA